MPVQLSDQEIDRRIRESVRLAIERKKILGLSYVAYDGENIIQYNPDGTKTILNNGDYPKYYADLLDKS